MRYKGDPSGRVYDIKPKKRWSRDTKDEVNEADIDINDLPSRTVLVTGRSERRGWCRVACIVNQKDPLIDNELYVPFSPTRRNGFTGMQLILCFGEQFYRRSWLRIDEIFEVPRSILEDGDMELQSKSFDKLEEFIMSRGG